MSLEYAIEFPCEMRRRQGEPSLRALARTGSLISRMVEDSIENARTPSEESVRFTAQYASELEKVEDVAAFCRMECPARLCDPLNESWMKILETLPELNEPICCLGRIRYPIEARFERFVADRVQLLYDTLGVDEWPHLLHILADLESPFDGEVTKDLRRVTTPDGLRFYELRLPIELARKASRLTTDNVFDLLAGFAATDGGEAGYQREIPVIALSDYAEFLEALLINDLSHDEISRLATQGSAYAQYIRFTHALRLAERLEVRVLLD